MAETVDQMIADIVRREGGYNEVAGDAGGATNDGISLKYLRGVGILRGDLDHNHVIDKFDIKLVTPAIAAQLYKQDFYQTPHIDKLPVELQPIVFDVAVNSGPPRGIMLLQKALSKLTGTFIPADGISGPQTALAAHDAITKYGAAAVVNAVVEKRIAWYNAIVAENPSQQKFLRGWINRANEFKV